MFVNARAIVERDGPLGLEILVQRRNKPGERRVLELPGGRVEEFESIVGALRREVREETGLELTKIEGLDTRIESSYHDTLVECVQPFAVYQTLQGPIDSIGAYFRCRAAGDPLGAGDETDAVRWMPLADLRVIVEADAQSMSWVDRAGLVFYLDRLYAGTAAERPPPPDSSPPRAAPKGFSHRQGQYLAFIHGYCQIHGQPPAEADMQRFFGVTPPSVHQMVLTLERRGLIARVPGAARSIRILVPVEDLPPLEER